LNPNLLATSDFLTSAFPAEYGNAVGGVFDVGFRSGNREKYEFTAQLAAFSGFEAMAEGPLNAKKNSSFLVSYRYSFVQIADYLGIPVGTNATPNYQDLSFKLDFANGKAGKFSIFGIGGLSDIAFLASETDEDFAMTKRDVAVSIKPTDVGGFVLTGISAIARPDFLPITLVATGVRSSTSGFAAGGASAYGEFELQHIDFNVAE